MNHQSTWRRPTWRRPRRTIFASPRSRPGCEPPTVWLCCTPDSPSSREWKHNWLRIHMLSWPFPKDIGFVCKWGMINRVYPIWLLGQQYESELRHWANTMMDITYLHQQPEATITLHNCCGFYHHYSYVSCISLYIKVASTALTQKKWKKWL